jgi:GDP-4-dehydro-6-deoxy-D-mannose reductase
MRALLEGLIDAFAVDATIETDPARVRAVDQPSVYADVSRLEADTGWRREIALEQTLGDLAAFWSDRIARGG